MYRSKPPSPGLSIGTLTQHPTIKHKNLFEGIFSPKTQKRERKVAKKPDKEAKINPEIIESDCDRIIQEMEAAYLADLENNHLGKPAVHKIRVLEKVLLKLKNPVFANYFLDKGGLEQFHNFLKKLPDGSWPLSSIRTSVLETLLDLPYNEHHLKYTKLGKTLTALQHSKSEHEENKKIIQEVKDKWLRIVAGQKIEYSNLENFEKENEKLMKKKRKRTTAQVGLGDQNFEEGQHDQLTATDPSKTIKMSYNFTIRPFSNLNKRDIRAHEASKTEEIDKYLSKIRKMTKQA